MSFSAGEDTGMAYKRNLKKIYEENAALMFRTAKSILRDDKLAEDIVQDAFLYMAGKEKIFFSKTGEEIAGLCVLMARNRSYNLLRDRRRESETDLGDEEANGLAADGVAGETVLDRIICSEEKRRFWGLVRQLPESYCTVLTLYYALDYSCREIGIMLRISTHAVENRLSRGRERLKKILEGNGYGGNGL